MKEETMIYGITLDDIWDTDKVVSVLKQCPKKPTIRVVFDEDVRAKEYVEPLTEISKHAFIMGELLDSFFVKDFTFKQYMARTFEYFDTLNELVSIWEAGNETNGAWLGQNPGEKFLGAQKYIHSMGGKTALTLYSDEEETMWKWILPNVPYLMGSTLDYVWISHYAHDNNDHEPNWAKTFPALASLFPNSKIGFGELGHEDKAKKKPLFDWYYNLKIDHPQFVGGYFWWYGTQDMIKSDRLRKDWFKKLEQQ